MEYVLFAFGDYTKDDPLINLIIDFVSQISDKDVKYQYGDSGIIVSFGTKQSSTDIVSFFEENLTKLTAMFFVFPVNDESIMSMDQEIYNHLFENVDFNSPETEKKIQIDFTESQLLDDNEMTESLNRVFDLLFKKPKKVERALSLDNILDKINEKGINSLTETEKQKLDEYSKK